LSKLHKILTNFLLIVWKPAKNDWEAGFWWLSYVNKNWHDSCKRF